ncbi:MAG: hypothetical protein WC711_03310 [Candidatus Staskawiczbacteria bacterium]|jgi:hypothetical protein
MKKINSIALAVASALILCAQGQVEEKVEIDQKGNVRVVPIEPVWRDLTPAEQIARSQPGMPVPINLATRWERNWKEDFFHAIEVELSSEVLIFSEDQIKPISSETRKVQRKSFLWNIPLTFLAISLLATSNALRWKGMRVSAAFSVLFAAISTFISAFFALSSLAIVVGLLGVIVVVLVTISAFVDDDVKSYRMLSIFSYILLLARLFVL